MQKILIGVGLIVLGIGVFYPYLKKIGLGYLPGDIFWRGENSSVYFPIVTCIIVSVVLTLIINFFK